MLPKEIELMFDEEEAILKSLIAEEEEGDATPPAEGRWDEGDESKAGLHALIKKSDSPAPPSPLPPLSPPLDAFMELHHLTGAQLEGLLRVLAPHYSNPGRRAPLRDFVVSSLVVLASKENYRELHERRLFKSRGWMHKTLHQFCALVVTHLSCLIQWPKPDVARDFEAIAGIPGVMGALDTCHLAITKAPVGQSSSLYSNALTYHSIQLLAVTDAKMERSRGGYSFFGSGPQASPIGSVAAHS